MKHAPHVGSPIRFNEEEHRYYDHRGTVPGVTSILQDAGLVTFNSKADMEYARDLGHAVHKATELYDLGTLDEASVADVVVPRLAAWKRFLSETGFIIETIEQRVFNEVFRYAGQLDRTGVFPQRSLRAPQEDVLLDIKSGMPQRATGPQTAAYEAALPKSKRARKRYAVHLLEDASYKLVPYHNPADFPVFLAALTVANFKKGK